MLPMLDATLRFSFVLIWCKMLYISGVPSVLKKDELVLSLGLLMCYVTNSIVKLQRFCFTFSSMASFCLPRWQRWPLFIILLKSLPLFRYSQNLLSRGSLASSSCGTLLAADCLSLHLGGIWGKPWLRWRPQKSKLRMPQFNLLLLRY